MQRSAEIFPHIFILVAAFLLNVVISRTVNLQREQIAILKAFGYSNMSIVMHYTKMVLIIVIIGIVGGLMVGAWLGKGLGRIYMDFYRFPFLYYELKTSVALTSALITILAALAGTIYSVWKAAKIPPAEAMRPEPPLLYRKIFIEKFKLWHLISQPTRMIIRNKARKPFKSLCTVIDISLYCAVMIAGTFSKDEVDFMIDIQFKLSQKEDMTITFVEPSSKNHCMN